MNAWHRRPFAAFDVESTGVSPDYDRIVTATLCVITRADVDTRSWLINPGIDIPQGATDVHGISTQQARTKGANPSDAIRDIAANVKMLHENGMPFVAYNAAFDFTMLERECRRYGAGFTLPYVIDPFVLDKELDRFRKGKRTLTAACEHYGVRLDGAHDATQDALAAARVAWRLAETYPDQVQIDPAHLHANQIQWKREQADSFGAYLIKHGKTDDVSREWPLQPPPADWTPDTTPEVAA